MRKEEYIQEVISRIENKKAKAEVEKELSNHIDDRISYYTDAGWDEETANEKAMEHMGAPEKVAVDMAHLHKGVSDVVVVLLIVAMIGLSLIRLFVFFFYDSMANTAGTLVSSIAFLLALFISSIVGNTRANKILTVLPIVAYVIVLLDNTIFYFINGNSISGFCLSIIFNITYMIKGESDALYAIRWLTGEVSFAPWMIVLSVVFCAVVFVLLLMSHICSTVKTKKGQWKKKINPFVIALMVLVCLLSLVSFVYGKANAEKPGKVENPDYEDVGIWTEYGQIYIIQANQPVDLSKYTEDSLKDDGTIIVTNWEWKIDEFLNNGIPNYTYYYTERLNVKTIVFDENISYLNQEMNIHFYPFMDYVYILKVNTYEDRNYWDEYDETKWIKTDRKTTLRFPKASDVPFPHRYYQIIIDTPQEAVKYRAKQGFDYSS